MAEMEYLPGGIKERLEDLRNRRKLTLKEVAEKTGIDYSTLSRIENGNVKKVGDDVLLKLARFFGVSSEMGKEMESLCDLGSFGIAPGFLADLLVVEGTLYPLLTRLKNDGLLSYEWQESTQGPPRKYYALSKEGEKFLEGLDAAWQELSNTINYLKNVTPKLLEVKD